MICDINDKECRKKFPRLKLKAAETQLVLKAFVFLWNQRMNKTNQVHQWVKIALEATAGMDAILKSHEDDWHLTTEKANDMLILSHLFLTCNTALCAHFQQEENRKLFQCGTFKAHWLQHSVMMSGHISPRRVWCYSGETYLSFCKQLMHSCLKGRGSLQSLQMVMERYVIALTLDLKRSSWRIR